VSSKAVKSTIWLDNGISPCFLAFEYDPHILLIFGDKILLVVQYGEEKNYHICSQNKHNALIT